MYVRMYVCMYVCMYVLTQWHTDMRAHTHTQALFESLHVQMRVCVSHVLMSPQSCKGTHVKMQKQEVEKTGAELTWPVPPLTLDPEKITPWFLVGNGGMDPYDSPLRSPYSSPKNPFLIPPFPTKNPSDR